MSDLTVWKDRYLDSLIIETAASRDANRIMYMYI